MKFQRVRRSWRKRRRAVVAAFFAFFCFRVAQRLSRRTRRLSATRPSSAVIFVVPLRFPGRRSPLAPPRETGSGVVKEWWTMLWLRTDCTAAPCSPPSSTCRRASAAAVRPCPSPRRAAARQRVTPSQPTSNPSTQETRNGPFTHKKNKGKNKQRSVYSPLHHRNNTRMRMFLLLKGIWRCVEKK